METKDMFDAVDKPFEPNWHVNKQCSVCKEIHQAVLETEPNTCCVKYLIRHLLSYGVWFLVMAAVYAYAIPSQAKDSPGYAWAGGGLLFFALWNWVKLRWEIRKTKRDGLEVGDASKRE